MNIEQKPGTIMIFPNFNRKGDSRQPEYRGQIMLSDGKIMYVSLWENKSKKGGRYFQGNVSDPKEVIKKGKSKIAITQMSQNERSKDHNAYKQRFEAPENKSSNNDDDLF